jgi:hypothetical protein
VAKNKNNCPGEMKKNSHFSVRMIRGSGRHGIGKRRKYLHYTRMNLFLTALFDDCNTSRIDSDLVMNYVSICNEGISKSDKTAGSTTHTHRLAHHLPSKSSKPGTKQSGGKSVCVSPSQSTSERVCTPYPMTKIK